MAIPAAIVVVLLLAGCGAPKAPAQSETDQKRARLETVADFFVAKVNGDTAAQRDLSVDPKASFIGESGSGSAHWRWEGSSIVVVVQGGAEFKVTASDSGPKDVVATFENGTTFTFVVKQVEGVWKIDSMEEGRRATEGERCRANQRTIEGAIQTYNASNPQSPIVGIPGTVLLLSAPEYAQLVETGALKSVPSCPSGGAYVMDGVIVVGDSGLGTTSMFKEDHQLQ